MSSMLKKMMTGFGILIFVLLCAIIIIPFVVDVDQYRPEVERFINENLNGKVTIGHLSLSLWGQIRVDIEGVELKDQGGKTLVKVSDAYFHLPFLPLIKGEPVFTLKMNEPSVFVVRSKAGKINLLSLIKTSKETPVQKPTQTEPSKPIELPPIARKARLGFAMTEAKLNFKDYSSDLSTIIDHLNLLIEDISLSKKTKMKLWADMNTQMGSDKSKAIKLEGPIVFELTAFPKIGANGFENANVTLFANLDDLSIEVPGTFQKSKGIKTNAKGDLFVSNEMAVINNLSLQFHNVLVNAKAKLTKLDSSPRVEFSMKSNDIDLSSWKELIPMLAPMDVKGTASLTSEVFGPTSSIEYTADLNLKNFSAALPGLKQRPTFLANIKVKTNEINHLHFAMKANKNNLNIDGSLQDFKNPKLKLAVTSKLMDLNELIVFPEPAPKSESKSSTQAEKEKAQQAAEQGQELAKKESEDLDKKLDPVRENAALKSFMGLIEFQFGKIIAKDLVIDDLKAKMTLKNLVYSIRDFGMSFMDGRFSGDFALDMKPKRPNYQFRFGVAHFNMKKAVQSTLELFKNTVYGSANFSIEGKGKSFNTDMAMANLLAKGNFKIENATFASVDVAKMMIEGINEGMDGVAKKVPAAASAIRSKKINTIKNTEAGYKLISSDFQIQRGRFEMPNFFAESHPNRAIDIKGNTSVGLIDSKLKTRWLLIDTYNLSKARDLSINQSGVEVQHILAKPNQPFQIPVTVGCTTSSPCYRYTEVPEFLGTIAFENVKSAVGARADAARRKAEDQARKRAEEEARKAAARAVKKVVPQKQQKKAQEGAKKALKGLFR